MKISKLRFKDCLGIEELDISVGKINMISGENEKGKTSILETIEKALYNTDRRPQFVRGKSGRAEIFVELDNGIEINRTVKSDNKSTLKVTKDGMKPSGPESYLKALLGKYALVFNPIDFLSKKDKEQTDILLEQIPISISKEDAVKWFGEAPSINYDQHGLVVCKLLENYFMEARKERTADVKAADGEIEFLKSQLPGGYDAEVWRGVVLQDYYKNIAGANKINANISKCQSQLDNAEVKIEGIELASKVVINSITSQQNLKVKQLEDEIERIKDLTIESIEKEYQAADEKIKEERDNAKIAKAYIEEHSSIDIAPLEQEQAEAEKMKGFVTQYDNLQRISKERDGDEKARLDYDRKVKDIRTKPAELLSTATMPIDGLGVDNGGNITINDLPIRNLSTSAQIRLALDIARATAGELKMICIDRFESLDAKIQAAFLEEIATDDFQYFITTVGVGDLTILSTLDNGIQINAVTGEMV